MCTHPERSSRALLAVLAFVVALLWVAGVVTPAAAQGNSMPGMDMPATPAASGAPAAAPSAEQQMPAASSRGVPLSAIIAAILFVLLVVAFIIARLGHSHSAGALGGLALLALVYGVTAYVVHVKKQPGRSTVWEATTMDMSAMKPIPGAAPVAIEKATSGPFTARVTYTGTVVALNDQDIYPRVTGRVVAVPVYDGDEVRPGQLIVRLDDDELSGREREAAAGQRAAIANAGAAREQVSAAEAMRRQKAAAAQAATVGITEASRMAAAAKARRTEAEQAVTEARHAAVAAGKEQSMAAARVSAAQAEAEAARMGLDNAGADLDAAEADLAYWQAEIKRMKALLDGGAASLDEYQVEEARHKTAAAMVRQKQALVAERKSMLNSALAKIREAQAGAERAAAQTAAAEAGADRVAAGVATAQAEYDAALTRVDQARAGARAAAEEVTSNAAQVRVATAQQRSMNAMAGQSQAALSVARTIRGYTEIRAAAPARVLRRVVSPGTLVNPGTLLLRLAQVDRVRLQANVSQADLEHVQVGSRVWAHPVDAPDQHVVAAVTAISPAADPASRTSVVEALVANPRRWFMPGQAVTMELETASLDRAVTVPSAAVVIPPGEAVAGGSAQRAVWTVTVEESKAGTTYTCVMHPQVHEDKSGPCPICQMPLVPEQTGGRKLAHLVNVTVGPGDGQRTQIVSGLAAGQDVIVRGTENLREGQAVQDVPWGDGGPLQLAQPAAGGSMPDTPGMSNMPGMSHSGHEGQRN